MSAKHRIDRLGPRYFYDRVTDRAWRVWENLDEPTSGPYPITVRRVATCGAEDTAQRVVRLLNEETAQEADK